MTCQVDWIASVALAKLNLSDLEEKHFSLLLFVLSNKSD